MIILNKVLFSFYQFMCAFSCTTEQVPARMRIFHLIFSIDFNGVVYSRHPLPNNERLVSLYHFIAAVMVSYCAQFSILSVSFVYIHVIVLYGRIRLCLMTQPIDHSHHHDISLIIHPRTLISFHSIPSIHHF
jgi:hypothetical protein